MKILIRCLQVWPERAARYIAWLAPLFARIVVGWVFLLSGWGKLHALAAVTHRLVIWGIPDPTFFAPFVSGLELIAGAFLLAGLLTRISAGALAIVMIVAIRSARWASVHSLGTLLSFDDTLYLALFAWLAIAGAGPISLDYWMQRSISHPSGPKKAQKHEPEIKEEQGHGTEAHGY